MMTKSYSTLLNYETFIERFEYLKLNGVVAQSTFGSDRYANQSFYHSNEWKDVRRYVIVRDNGCDLGLSGYEVHDGLLVHHLNPIDIDDVYQREYALIDPENLITTSHNTHNAIHYGDESLLPKALIVRTPGDTKLW